MYRIGILGSESTHAEAFLQIINGSGDYPDMKITAVGGSCPGDSERLCLQYGLDRTFSEPEEILGQVDAVMITARRGEDHLRLARPFLEQGLPLFVDKPFAASPEDAAELCRLSARYGAPVTGGSSLKYMPEVLRMQDWVRQALERGDPVSGDVSAPVRMHNDWGGFLFYAPHLTEISLTVFGMKPEAVTARRLGDHVGVVADYPGYLVTNRFLQGFYRYTVTVNSPERGEAVSLEAGSAYALECRNFGEMLRTGTGDQTPEQLIMPVRYMQAVKQSYEKEKTVRISEMGGNL